MKHYTYAHIRLDTNSIFYIGKGSKRRAWSRESRNEYWHRIAKKHQYAVKILSYWNSAEDALDHEKFLIQCLKDVGVNLCNQTDGGDGLFNPSHEIRAKMSKNISLAHSKPETKKKMSESAILKFTNSSEREKVSDGLKRYFKSNKAREKQSNALKNYFSNEENKLKIEKINQSKPNVIPVFCITTGESYPSMSAAAKAKNIQAASIYANVTGRTKRAGQFVWRKLNV